MLFATLASALLALTATPDELEGRVPDQDILSVQFTNGTIARVRVLGMENGLIKLREIVLDGSMEVRHRLDEFEPSSAFRIELAARNPQTYEDHFAMAKRAAAFDLSNEAGQQVAAAMLLLEGQPDAASATMALRTWSANALEGWLRDAIQQRDLTDAMHYLTILATRYSDLRTEDQLGELALAVETLERDRAAKRQADRQARLDKRTLDGIERRLAPILKDIERGDELYRKAISKSGKMTQSAKLASQAIDAYRAAWSSSLALQKRHPEEQSLVVEIESIANHLHDHTILAALHAANLLAVRSDFLGAMERVQWVLAVDPTHADALEMQRTITIAGAAASSVWGVGWGDADPR